MNINRYYEMKIYDRIKFYMDKWIQRFGRIIFTLVESITILFIRLNK